MPPAEPAPEPPTRRPEPTYGLSRQERHTEQQAIWDEAAADTGRVRKKLRHEMIAVALVLLAACGGFLFFMSR